MLDFIKIKKKDKNTTIYPDFAVSKRIKDLMIRGGAFYAIWDEEAGLWSTDEYDIQRLVDRELYLYNEKYDNEFHMALLEDDSSKMWMAFKNYIKRLPDNYHELDCSITFANTPTKKEDYISKRLPYEIRKAKTPAYDKIISTLYSPEEREKIEWAIGSIIAGDSKWIQKFIVFYGESGSGKSTVMNIIGMLFNGYCKQFEAKTLAQSSNSFALEAFKENPLVAINHDGDLSRIEDNTRLNSIISHEKMIVNEKFKSQYTMSFHSFLFMGTNSPVKITDARSGMNRRLIDVHPSNNRLAFDEYNDLMKKIEFELGGIAQHCLDIYTERGSGYYNTYVPIDMISSTNSFYDYICENYDVFKREEFISLKSAWSMYKEYCDYARITYPLTLQRFKEELKAYFEGYIVNGMIGDVHVRNTYRKFRTEKVEGLDESTKPQVTQTKTWLIFEEIDSSIFNIIAADYPAQYATEGGIPTKRWRNCTETLKDIATSQLHYVKVPENHIVIDFDIKNKNGEKDLALNIKAASKWPETYAELSKSGCGIHLHYIYDGDVTQLSRVYDENIEIKVFTGDSSLRRQLTKCVNNNIAHLNSGLPLKEASMVDFKSLKNEKALRTLIRRNLLKEYHADTTSSIHFIRKILDDAYASGMKYDVTDMRPAIQAFALNSSHQADHCLAELNKMRFCSEMPSDNVANDEAPIIFLDVEVFPNVFICCWKFDNDDPPFRMIQPSIKDIEEVMKYRFIGHNVKEYDNHILYAWSMGYNNLELFNLSQRIIAKSPNSKFAEARNASYADTYDFASAGNKKSLKAWEIELGCNHLENRYEWDKPLPEDKWEEVTDYCCNDVEATRILFHHLKGDWIARQILANITDSIVNDSTNTLSTRLIFGSNRKPQGEFCYRDLSKPVHELDPAVEKFLEEACPEMMAQKHGPENSLLPYFPGYEFHFDEHSRPHSIYRDVEVGEGGNVYAEWGIYVNVALLDISSQHPSSTIAECLFGPRYTQVFRDLVQARIAIKHEDWEFVKKIFDGRLAKYVQKVIDGELTSKELANACKTVINSCYGLTAAPFDNPYRDPRNVDNIVAKRGALFMENLKHEVQARGFTVAHIKTDSIKIPNATPEIIQFVMDFGKKYGYSFEHEATYEKMCLVNNAVYIAKYASAEWCEEHYGYAPGDNKKKGGKWTATGKQFAVPYIFKTLFSKEEVVFDDLTEIKNVQKGALYLDLNESLPEGEHNLKFVGRVGNFCPIKPGCDGGLLVKPKDDKWDSVTGCKGYRWLEAEDVRALGHQDDIDMSYFHKLADKAIDAISQYGDFEWFVS